MNASQGMFLKNTKTLKKLKPKRFLKIATTLLLRMPKFRQKYYRLVKLELLKLLLESANYMHFVNIRFRRNNPGFKIQ